MKYLIFALVLLPGFAFCDETLNFKATYTVPVQDPALVKFSTFKIDDYQVHKSENEIHLNYTLPLVLTGGEPTSVDLKLVLETQSERFFSGPLGSARCQGAWNLMSCETRMNLKLDDHKILEFIKNNISEDEQIQTLKIARSFSTEPIGFSKTFEP